MFGLYSRKRRGLFLAVAIGSGLFWSGVGMPLPAHAQATDPATQLYVSNINAGWVRGTGTQKKGVAIIDIVDGNGNPVNGARVIGNWSGCFKLNGVSDTTETVCTTAAGTTTCVDGRAVIWGRSHTCRGKNCLFWFTITDVRNAGMTYVPVGSKTSGGQWCDPFSAGVAMPRLAQAQAPDPATQLKVSYIYAGWFHRASGKQSHAVVDIIDGNGNPVNGALVVGNWSGCFKQKGVSDTTETVCTTADGTTTCVDGRADIPGKLHTCLKNNCQFTFTITGVQKDGMTYIPVVGKTSSSIWCKP